MAQPDVIQSREQFEQKLRQTASNKAIPIQQLAWRDVPNKDASDLTIESGGKKRVFTISNPDLRNDVQGQLELILNQVIDNE
jgi:hypothetical protein